MKGTPDRVGTALLVALAAIFGLALLALPGQGLTPCGPQKAAPKTRSIAFVHASRESASWIKISLLRLAGDAEPDLPTYAETEGEIITVDSWRSGQFIAKFCDARSCVHLQGFPRKRWAPQLGQKLTVRGKFEMGPNGRWLTAYEVEPLP